MSFQLVGFLLSSVILRLDRDIKNVRMLLLLFPDEIVGVVPAIVNAGRGTSPGDGRAHAGV